MLKIYYCELNLLHFLFFCTKKQDSDNEDEEDEEIDYNKLEIVAKEQTKAVRQIWEQMTEEEKKIEGFNITTQLQVLANCLKV